jgi:hypothetical protein
MEGRDEYGCTCENADGHPPDDLEAPHVHRTRRRLRERPFHDGTHETDAVFTFEVTTSRPNDDRPVGARCAVRPAVR